MELYEVNRGIKKFKRGKRIGRGPGSGNGKTAARGHKGAKSRAGYSKHPTFQGGTMPIVRRIPKRGFNNKFALAVVSINVSDLEREFSAGEEVTPESLRSKGLAKKRHDILKVLGDGKITTKLTVTAHRFSKSAQEKIEAAGGKCVLIPGKVAVEEKKKQAAEAKK